MFEFLVRSEFFERLILYALLASKSGKIFCPFRGLCSHQLEFQYNLAIVHVVQHDTAVGGFLGKNANAVEWRVRTAMLVYPLMRHLTQSVGTKLCSAVGVGACGPRSARTARDQVVKGQVLVRGSATFELPAIGE